MYTSIGRPQVIDYNTAASKHEASLPVLFCTFRAKPTSRAFYTAPILVEGEFMRGHNIIHTHVAMGVGDPLISIEDSVRSFSLSFSLTSFLHLSETNSPLSSSLLLARGLSLRPSLRRFFAVRERTRESACGLNPFNSATSL